LWANALGKGGIIPIETMLYPCSGFLELKLTGLQGDVMKESMNVAQTLAWDLTDEERKQKICKNNKLTLDTSTSYAQDILSSLSKAELSKFKSNPGSYSPNKDGSIQFEAFDPFKNKNTKTVCRKL
jgi:hypothetical protein